MNNVNDVNSDSTAVTAEVIKKVCDQQNEILEKMAIEYIDVYLFLKKEFEKGNVSDNFVFQYCFRAYYGLDFSRLTGAMVKRFFELLAERQTDLDHVLSELYKIKIRNSRGEFINSMQFSFATKLLHTIDDDLPIFDHNLGEIFHLEIRGGSKEDKIASRLDAYEKLKSYYKNLLRDEQMQEVITTFKSKFKINSSHLSDTKILDFIFGALKKARKAKEQKE